VNAFTGENALAYFAGIESDEEKKSFKSRLQDIKRRGKLSTGESLQHVSTKV
jgi:hypothetical protein